MRRSLAQLDMTSIVSFLGYLVVPEGTMYCRRGYLECPASALLRPRTFSGCSRTQAKQRAEHNEGERERQRVCERVCKQQREADSSSLRFLVKPSLSEIQVRGYQLRVGSCPPPPKFAKNRTHGIFFFLFASHPAPPVSSPSLPLTVVSTVIMHAPEQPHQAPRQSQITETSTKRATDAVMSSARAELYWSRQQR